MIFLYFYSLLPPFMKLLNLLLSRGHKAGCKGFSMIKKKNKFPDLFVDIR